MIDEAQLRHRMQRIGDLVHKLEGSADARELMQTVMDLHGAALDRILAAVREAGDPGHRILETAAADPVISSVLLLYGLHPLDFENRVRRAVAKIRGAEVVSIANGAVRVRVRGVDHAIAARSIRSEIENELYEAAPDATSLVIEGLERFAPADFVPLESVGAISPRLSLSQHGD